ncbi:DUF1127 domain-containing protein [Tropicimonas sp. S265A]|uniref:DUF1127 domain-containing protein n=1 Tax=Tropicimonas sp. S265A TaxID=3415134 RepID=UPI003C7A43FE
MARLAATRSAISLFLRRRAVVRQVTAELNYMSERDLTDLGISRTAIPRLAREAALEVA